MSAQVIEDAVAHGLRLAETWTEWDGQPIAVEDRGYTPHKAIRRLADHPLDHLAEFEARVAGQTPLPDHWHASAVLGPCARSRCTSAARSTPTLSAT
jgi:hypothetical protein